MGTTKVKLEFDPPQLLEIKANQTQQSLSKSGPDKLSWPLALVFRDTDGEPQVFADSIAVSSAHKKIQVWFIAST